MFCIYNFWSTFLIWIVYSFIYTSSFFKVRFSNLVAPIVPWLSWIPLSCIIPWSNSQQMNVKRHKTFRKVLTVEKKIKPISQQLTQNFGRERKIGNEIRKGSEKMRRSEKLNYLAAPVLNYLAAPQVNYSAEVKWFSQTSFEKKVF